MDTTLKVVLLNWRDIRNPLSGGAEVHIWEVFSRLAKRGWQVTAICAGFEGSSRSELVDGISVHRCGGPYSYSLCLPLAYRRFLAQDPPDIVVDFLNKLPLFSPWYAKRLVVCFTHHLFGGDAATGEAGSVAGLVVRGLESLVPIVYRKTRFLVGAQSTVNDLVSRGIRPEMITLVPYGVDVQKYYPRQKSPNPFLLYVGRVKRYKGIDHLIRIVPSLLRGFPGLEVHIAGKGDALPELQQLVADLELEGKVTFHGFVSEEEKRTLYQQAWATFFLSCKEGFGLTVAEAALCMTPTVAYNVAGLCDAVTDGRTGLLVPYGDVVKLEAAIIQVLDGSSRRHELAEAARRRYSALSWETVADQMAGLLVEFARR